MLVLLVFPLLLGKLLTAIQSQLHLQKMTKIGPHNDRLGICMYIVHHAEYMCSTNSVCALLLAVARTANTAMLVRLEVRHSAVM